MPLCHACCEAFLPCPDAFHRLSFWDGDEMHSVQLAKETASRLRKKLRRAHGKLSTIFAAMDKDKNMLVNL